METTLPRDLAGSHDDGRDQRPLTKASIIINYLLILVSYYLVRAFHEITRAYRVRGLKASVHQCVLRATCLFSGRFSYAGHAQLLNHY